MPRYIDAYKIPYHDLSDGRGKCEVAFLEDIIKVPTANVRENVRGEWIRWYEEIKHDDYTEYIPHCKCPKCGIEYDSHTVKFLNYCPNCGADMRGEQCE